VIRRWEVVEETKVIVDVDPPTSEVLIVGA